MLKIKENKKSTRWYFNLGFCILLWGAIPVVSKKAMVDLNNIQLLFYSTVFSTLVLGTMVLREKRWQTMRAYRFSDYLHMGGLGFLGNYLYYIFLYGALSRTAASEGFIIAYMWPILVLVLSFIILKEKVTTGKVVSISISFAGMIIIVTKGNISNIELTSLYGDFLAVCGAFIFALYSVLGKKVNYDNTFSVFIYFLTALLFLVPTMMMTSGFEMPEGEVWIWIVINGCFVNGISYIFWFKALKYGRTEIIANLLYLTPFVSLVYIYLFLDEKIMASSLVGLLVIMLGVISQYVREGRKAGRKDKGLNSFWGKTDVKK